LALLQQRRQMQFVLIDPKGRAFEAMAGLPHLLRPIVTQPDQAVQVLSDLVNLMEQRDRSRVTDPRVVVAVDELADLVQTGGPAILESGTVGAAWTRRAFVVGARNHPVPFWGHW
jgi:S-DNA-T family DNA segregation ATPase FtsK/SpoIIIE